MNVIMRSVTVNQLIMPARANLEQVTARAMLMFYGKESFPGIRKAEVIFTEGQLIGNDEKFDEEGEIPIGCCGDCRFGGKHPAMAVAKQLNLEGKRELAPLLKVLGEGFQGSESDLASLVKTFRRVHKPKTIVEWATTAVDAIIVGEVYKPAEVSGEVEAVDLFNEIVKANPRYFSEEVVVGKIRQLIQNGRETTEPTELSSVVRAIFRRPGKNGQPHNTGKFVRGWAEQLFAAIYLEQREFQSQVSLVRGLQPVSVKATLKGEELALKLLHVRSDNDQAERAARYIGMDLVLVEKKSGHFQIFCNHRKYPSLSLRNVARMIEWLEIPVDQRPGVFLKDLGDFTRGGQEIWYAYEGNLFNRPPAEASKISPAGLIELIRHGFCRSGIFAWCNDRNIRIYSSGLSDSGPRLLVNAPPVNGKPKVNGHTALSTANSGEPVALAGNGMADALATLGEINLSPGPNGNEASQLETGMVENNGQV